MTAPAAPGTLYLVSTPIGNLEDMPPRAVRILDEADLVAAEDTRHTGLLLKHFGLQKRLESYHDYNKEKTGPRLIQRLLNGETVALVCDAGTPGIADPAFNLVRSAAQSGIPVVPIPGPTAAIAALSVSGLPTDRFVFEGFLPAKKGRRTRLGDMAKETRTLILYESPHRLIRTLGDLLEALGDRPMSVSRELTKKFEETSRGRISEILALYSGRKIMGEFVLIIHGTLDKEKK
jgi:16S rRNA (cytidine1402-2'-O)-methyltransferase